MIYLNNKKIIEWNGNSIKNIVDKYCSSLLDKKELNYELKFEVTYKGLTLSGADIFDIEIINKGATVTTDRFVLGNEIVFTNLFKKTLALLGYDENVQHKDYLDIINKYEVKHK